MRTLHERQWLQVMRDSMANAKYYVGDCPPSLGREIQMWAEDNAGALDDLLASFESALRRDAEPEQEAA